MSFIVTGRTFGQAVCDHLGLPAAKVLCDLSVRVEPDEAFGVNLIILLTGEDLIAIGKRMQEPLPQAGAEYRLGRNGLL